MGKVVKGLLGIVGLGGSEPQVSAKQATADTDAAKKESKRQRASLFETSGGVVGEELQPDQVQKRQSLFGN